jgi:hypothetical protein
VRAEPISLTLIEVHIIVHDRAGKSVSGLTKEQFSVFDPGEGVT